MSLRNICLIDLREGGLPFISQRIGDTRRQSEKELNSGEGFERQQEKKRGRSGDLPEFRRSEGLGTFTILEFTSG